MTYVKENFYECELTISWELTIIRSIHHPTLLYWYRIVLRKDIKWRFIKTQNLGRFLFEKRLPLQVWVLKRLRSQHSTKGDSTISKVSNLLDFAFDNLFEVSRSMSLQLSLWAEALMVLFIKKLWDFAQVFVFLVFGWRVLVIMWKFTFFGRISDSKIREMTLTLGQTFGCVMIRL